MKHLYLMRHGQTLFNVRRKIQGWCDSPLTELGIEQAKAARECLQDITFDHYYSSTAERCCDTLEIVTHYEKNYKRLKGLKERYFGTFEGESEDLNPSKDSGIIYDDIFPYYGGEYRKDVRKRMVDTLTEIMEKDDHETVLAVSHAGACLAFFEAWEDPMIIFNNGGFSNCCILHFTYDSHQFQYIETIRPQL